MPTLQNIISETDVLVPNGYGDADKVAWLNGINQEFFDVVKIPLTTTFTAIPGTKAYTLSASGIKEKNIDKVMIGHLKYLSLNYEDVQPGQNWFTFDEASKKLDLSVAPSRSGVAGIVRYSRSATSTFTTAVVATQSPDAPSEHHWIYVLGLAEYIAKAQEEDEKAANYGAQYRNALNVAAQNYRKVVAS